MERTLPAGDHDVTYCQSSMPARIFSLPLNNYTGKFDHAGSLRPARVPSQVISVIGGTPSGGAFKTSPLEWSDIFLQYVFNPALNRPPYTPPATYILANGTNTNSTTASATPSSTSSPSPSHSTPPSTGSSHTGAIAGGVVGGVAGLALIGILIFFCLFRRKRTQPDNEGPRTSELPSYLEAKEIADRDTRNEVPRSPPVEMPTPGTPTPLGWHDERVGEAGDNVTPLVGHRNGDAWGREGAGTGNGHRRVGSDSRFSEMSDESGVTAVGSSPGASPRIPRREVGAASKQSMRSDVTN